MKSRIQYMTNPLFLTLAFLFLTITGSVAQEVKKDSTGLVVAQEVEKDTQEEVKVKKEKEKKDTRPIKSTFESAWLIDNQSVMVPIKGTLEFDILHRFGVWKNGYDDLYGLFAPANIRMGFSYSILDNLGVGFGFTKSNLIWDLNVKYALLKQSRSGNIPISITYFGNIAIDSRDKSNFLNGTDRLSYFHQLILARKVTPNLSVQVAPSLSHFNAVEAFLNSEGEIEPLMKNDHFAISAGGRYKLSSTMALIANYDQPITVHKSKNPQPNISLGIEMTTSSHAFQIFVGNYSFLTPQRNNVFNQNDYRDNQFLIGFNITRLWNL